MATRLYGLSKGETEFSVTEGVGSATAADNIELTVDFGASVTPAISKEDVIKALEMFANHITKNQWPPA